MGAMVDLYCASYATPPAAVTLDIDDTVDVVHGHQQLVAVQRPLRRALLPADPCLRHRHQPPGRGAAAPRQDPLGQGGARPSAPAGPPHPPALAPDPHHHPRRWPLRPAGGDGLVRENGLDFIFGLPGNAVLDRAVERPPTTSAPAARSTRHPALRGFAETRHRAKSWDKERRVCARIEATTKGLDIRYVVTCSRPDRPSISTRRSTAPAARPRT